MPLKMKTVKGIVTLTWTSPTMEASWKIRPSATEEEIVSTLSRVLVFVKSQTGSVTAQMNPTAPAPALGAGQATATTATDPGSTDPGRVLMMPPVSLSDRPSDGGPPKGEIDWGSMPTTTVPAELQGTWEMAPPEEMTW